MPQPNEMVRPLNPHDVLLGEYLGTQLTAAVLRLAGTIDGLILLWGQIIGLGGGVLLIARLSKSRSATPNTEAM